MKLDFLKISGFRGYQKPVRFEFSDSFTIIDGRNGVGKSTIFDAIEFALTGTISKYFDAKAGGESVEDYLWWSGDRNSFEDRFVEVGFRDNGGGFTIKRTATNASNLDVSSIARPLVDVASAPDNALAQLCASTIIRDEHISRLSLDLKETDRFALLRDAIGAVDADGWIKRAQSLVSAAQLKVQAALREVDQANRDASALARQLDQVRSSLPARSLINEAARRLQVTLQTTAPVDQIVEVAQQKLVDIARDLDQLRPLIEDYPKIVDMQAALPELKARLAILSDARTSAREYLRECIEELNDAPISTVLNQEARQLERLVSIGQALGRRAGQCPLCASGLSHEAFEHGLEIAISAARRLDSQAVDQAAKERARDHAQAALEQAEASHSSAKRNLDEAMVQIADFQRRLTEANFPQGTLEQVREHAASLVSARKSIMADLRLLNSVALDQTILRATAEHAAAQERIVRAEATLGRARRAEVRAKVLHDAARRAAAETLDQRLDRVLPLMSELYRRLRPHPLWGNIEYSVRGDVRRFLKLQVGRSINPQFVFSSGQRRATGLAFLLSVNLSIAWSRWRSILLDDPVQHVDDFRAVHLAEVLAQLCYGGRQIVCAVEDSALADLMCRRLPTSENAPGNRISLGNDPDGAIFIVSNQQIAPMNRRVLVMHEGLRA